MLLVTCDPRESWLHVHLNRDTRRMELSETGPQQAKVKTSPHASRPERFCRCEVPHNWSQLKYLVRPLTAIQGVFCLLLLKFATFAIPGYPPRHELATCALPTGVFYLLTYLLIFPTLRQSGSATHCITTIMSHRPRHPTTLPIDSQRVQCSFPKDAAPRSIAQNSGRKGTRAPGAAATRTPPPWTFTTLARRCCCCCCRPGWGMTAFAACL